MGHSPGHVTMTLRAIVIWTSSYEHDLPGVLQADGTCPLAVVLQVELSSTCQQAAVTVTPLGSQQHLAQARLSSCCCRRPSPVWRPQA